MGDERDFAASPRAWDALTDIWRALRDDCSPTELACAAACVGFARAADLLTPQQEELWLRRLATCPGHDDEGGRSWCAYCGDMEIEFLDEKPPKMVLFVPHPKSRDPSD